MNTVLYNSEDLPVPVKIIVESRNSSRVSLGKNEIIIRLPKHISVAEKEKTLKQFINWAKQQIQEKEYYKAHQKTISYYQNKQLTVMDKSFIIQLDFIETGKSRLSYRGDFCLKIYLLKSHPEKKQVQDVQRFLLRFTEKYFLAEIQKRTLFWNDFYFKEKIEKIDIKHTVSRWGSCSASRKISFSTKLLLTPSEVIDYVIVHELAHLKEMNHSSRFWKHVENVLPNYTKQRKWLKENGNKIEF